MQQRGSGDKQGTALEEEVESAVQFLEECDQGSCLAHLRTLRLEVMLNALEALKVAAGANPSHALPMGCGSNTHNAHLGGIQQLWLMVVEPLTNLLCSLSNL